MSFGISVRDEVEVSIYQGFPPKLPYGQARDRLNTTIDSITALVQRLSRPDLLASQSSKLAHQCLRFLLLNISVHKLSTFHLANTLLDLLTSTARRTMAVTKKRKASVLEEDGASMKNGHKSPVSSLGIKKEDYSGPAMKKEEINETRDRLYETAETPFKVECPAHPKKRKSRAVDDVFGPEHENGGFENLDITYAIRPGNAWSTLKPYRNFIVGEQKFSLGSTVYINRHFPAPPAPPPGSSEAAILAYDQANLWVAKVLEVRAKDNQHVYLRLFWLYWPDELPNGRQAYHGVNEFIMSNAMDIVDAMTVAGPAEVTHWDEQKDDQEDLGQRFFRQFLDIKKLGGPKGSELSAIRQHCICHKYYNPDKTMYKCPQEDCGMWNHEECLIEAILNRTYKKLVEESGPAANGTEATISSVVKTAVTNAVTKTLFPASKMRDLRTPQTPSSPIKSETASPRSASKAKKKLKDANRRQGMFNAKIINGEDGENLKVTVTDERGQDPETWVEDVECLKCGKVLH